MAQSPETILHCWFEEVWNQKPAEGWNNFDFLVMSQQLGMQLS